MKKIFTGIIIIVSSFLFYDIYNKYQTTHEDNLYGIDSINNKFNNIVTFEQTNYENNKEDITAFEQVDIIGKVNTAMLDKKSAGACHQT